ncbi:MAG: hypothetical protein WBN75_15965 [Verrucomicrobiia bacterium]
MTLVRRLTGSREIIANDSPSDMESQLKAVRASVEKEGELTEAAIQSVKFHGKPYSLTEDLEKLRSELQQNPEGLEAPALRATQKERVLTYLDRKLGFIAWEKSECEEHETKEEEARQAAAVLPSPEVLDDFPARGGGWMHTAYKTAWRPRRHTRMDTAD